MAPLHFEATSAASLSEISSFLRDLFQAPADSANLNEMQLAWKYYEPGPEWDGSRSYALRKEGAMVAHSGIWPIPLVTPAGPVKALQAVDWAGSRTSPGSGVVMMSKLRTLADILITVGGSEDTRRVLPAMGFKQRGSARTYARVLHPLRQFRSRRFAGARDLARGFRNALWRYSPLASDAGWSSRNTIPDRDLIARINALATDGLATDYPISCHEARFFRFMLRCPAAAVSYFELLRDGVPQGYFVTSRAGGQIRLAELRILSDKPQDLAAAYAAAVGAAALDPEGCELVTSAFVPRTTQALEANGFHWRGESPVFVLDPKRLLGEANFLALSMLDDDSAFLNSPEDPYCT